MCRAGLRRNHSGPGLPHMVAIAAHRAGLHQNVPSSQHAINRFVDHGTDTGSIVAYSQRAMATVDASFPTCPISWIPIGIASIDTKGTVTDGAPSSELGALKT